MGFLSDEQLNEAFQRLKDGQSPADIREAMGMAPRVQLMYELRQKYGIAEIEPVARKWWSRNRSAMIASFVDHLMERLARVDEVDEVIAALEDGIVRLTTKREELQAEAPVVPGSSSET